MLSMLAESLGAPLMMPFSTPREVCANMAAPSGDVEIVTKKPTGKHACALYKLFSLSGYRVLWCFVVTDLAVDLQRLRSSS